MRFICLILMAGCIDESKLPRWDIQKLYGYADLSDASYLNALEKLNKRAENFRTTYYGTLEESLEDALREYSDIGQRYRNLDQFVGSVLSIHRDDAEVMKAYSAYNTQRGEVHGAHLEWLSLQIIRLPQSVVDSWLSKSALVKSLEPWLIQTRLLAKHVLSEEVEQALTLRENWFGSSPVVEYFNTMLVQARYKFPKQLLPSSKETDDDKTELEDKKTCSGSDEFVELNESRLLNYLQDSDWQVRATALEAFNRGLAENKVNHFSCLSLNQVAGKEAIENKVRGWPTIRSARNLSNMLSDDVVDALLKAVKTDGVRLNKRFYLLKRKILEKLTGRAEFTWADRNAPLNLRSKSEDADAAQKRFEWSESLDIIRDSFGHFSTTFAEMFQKLVDDGRIDAPATHGKRGGAFCMLGTPDVGPVVFTNYLGKDEDVATVAHECGHAIHGALTYKQPFLLQDPATAIAEVASIFGEMLVFKKLLAKEPAAAVRLEKLMNKLNSIMNTVVRQVSFDRFEELVHTAKKDGFVSEEEMRKFWRRATEEFYGTEGEIFTSLANTDNMWAYVPHFHELPFYVYSYAFADLTVGTLYALYEKNVFPSEVGYAPDITAARAGPKSFQERFIALLASGSSKSFVEMISEFELDGASPEYWRSAFVDYVEPLLSMAEELAEKI